MVKKKNLKLVKHVGSKITVAKLKKAPAGMGLCVWREGAYVCDIVHKTRKVKHIDHKKHNDCLDCLRCTGGHVHDILCKHIK
jgi:hypothetical protein